MDEEIGELRRKIARTRYEFVKTELETCFTAAEMGTFELRAGNVPVAEREVAFVESGIRVIRRFAVELPEEQRTAMEARLVGLQAMLASLKAELLKRAAW
jgi:hypothetical protein